MGHNQTPASFSCYNNSFQQEFANETASESPAPGGGSIAAYVGSLGVALGTMVANLSANKKGWEDKWHVYSAAAEKGQNKRPVIVLGRCRYGCLQSNIERNENGQSDRRGESKPQNSNGFSNQARNQCALAGDGNRSVIIADD